MNIPHRKGRKSLWLRVTLPNEVWKHPSVLISSIFQNVEVYLHTQLIYQHGNRLPSLRNKFAVFQPHIIPLTSDFAGKRLYLRIYSDDPQNIGIDRHASVWLGEAGELLTKLVKESMSAIIFGVLFTCVGVFSVGIFLGRWEQRFIPAVSFGSFSLCIGIAHLSPNLSTLCKCATVWKVF